MTYRQVPAQPPLIVSLSSALLALNPDSGALLWHQIVDHPSDRRVFRLPGRVLVTFDYYVTAYDLATGHPTGSVTLPFRIHAGLVHEDRLYVGGDGAACVTAEGVVLWVVRDVDLQEKSMFKQDRVLIGQGSTGQELWRLKPLTSTSMRAALMLGLQVAQTDADT